MAVARYVALLRAVNVGGRNVVPMAALRAAFEEAGFDAVSTYIQSGNVLFESGLAARSVERRVDDVLTEHLGSPAIAVVRSHRQLRAVVAGAPPGFGGPDHHCDAIFPKPPLTPAAVMRVVQLRDGVDQVWPGNGVVYFARLSARRTQSRMSKIVGTPEYRSMTIRSWATTTTLLRLLDDRAGASARPA
jgi:uncharacterized protein (DUF1697 family)